MSFSLAQTVNEAGRLNRLFDKKKRVDVHEAARIESYLDSAVRSGEIDFSEKQKELNFIIKAILNSQIEREKRK